MRNIFVIECSPDCGTAIFGGELALMFAPHSCSNVNLPHSNVYRGSLDDMLDHAFDDKFEDFTFILDNTLEEVGFFWGVGITPDLFENFDASKAKYYAFYFYVEDGNDVKCSISGNCEGSEIEPIIEYVDSNILDLCDQVLDAIKGLINEF